MSALRDNLQQRREQLTPVKIEGVLPDTVYLHQLSASRLDAIRQASSAFDDADEVTIDVARFNLLLIAETMRDEAGDRHYSASDVDIAALREDILPGERETLLEYINAMLGYRNTKSRDLPTLRVGGSSASGAATGSGDSQAS